MDEFQITLPSNSSPRFHPTNGPNNFTVQLPIEYQLDGPWEVALIDIIYPHPNVNLKKLIFMGVAIMEQGWRRQISDMFDGKIYAEMIMGNLDRLPDGEPRPDLPIWGVKDNLGFYQARDSLRLAVKDDPDHQTITLISAPDDRPESDVYVKEETVFVNWNRRTERNQKNPKATTKFSLPAFDLARTPNFLVSLVDGLYKLKQAFSYIRFEIRPGYLSSIDQLCEAINTELRFAFVQFRSTHTPAQFFYNKKLDRIEARSGTITTTIFVLGDYLPRFMGIGYGGPGYTAKYHRLDIEAGSATARPYYSPEMDVTHSMFVFSELVKYQVVGDIEAPLLATLPVTGRNKETCYWSCDPPYYIPVAQTTLNSINIKICNEDGEPFPFPDDGKVFCRLNFRRRRIL